MSSSTSNGTSGAAVAKENVSPRVPNCTVMETPLDFSFLKIITLKGADIFLLRDTASLDELQLILSSSLRRDCPVGL